jgi:hypothetical protein
MVSEALWSNDQFIAQYMGLHRRDLHQKVHDPNNLRRLCGQDCQVPPLSYASSNRLNPDSGCSIPVSIPNMTSSKAHRHLRVLAWLDSKLDLHLLPLNGRASQVQRRICEKEILVSFIYYNKKTPNCSPGTIDMLREPNPGV